VEDPALLSKDIPFADAAIYRLNATQALVQSVDFFTPLVDDPYRYGQIAAANALSDLYAVGARPLLALNLVAFPLCQLGVAVLQQILAGGAERVQAAGAVIGGGHSIEDAEPKYGLCVTGIVDPEQMLTTSGCRPGDQLILTKPLGTGLLATALKGEVLREAEIEVAIQGMIQLNRTASEVMQAVGATACTDVTGFGLVGHALEMAEASGVALRLRLSRLPAYPRALEMAGIGLVPEGAYRNRDYYFPRVAGLRLAGPLQRDLLSDPQTSGGLLIAVHPERLARLQGDLAGAGVPAFHLGEVVAGPAGQLELVK
jgi:selenide,water dikinase